MSVFKIDRMPGLFHRRVYFLALVMLMSVVVSAAQTSDETATSSDRQTIAMIGAGNVGSALGTLWAAAGYHVIFATRHPDELDNTVERAGHGAQASAVGPAIEQADIIALAVPYKAEPAIAEQYGASMQNKILVDANNAFPGRDGVIADRAERMGEAAYSAQLFDGTRFIRAFNMISASQYPAPDRLDTADFDVVYTTNDASVRATAEALIRATGGRPVYKGELANAPEYEF